MSKLLLGMKRKAMLFLMLLPAIGLTSCIPPSTEDVVKMDVSDPDLIRRFGIEAEGKIIYQFYQKYGFTDVEEQLIVLMKPDRNDLAVAEWSIDPKALKSMRKIEQRKFMKGKPVDIDVEKTRHADIRLEAKEYGQSEPFVMTDGTAYAVCPTDTTETVFIYDRRSGVLYVESKKGNQSYCGLTFKCQQL